MKLTHSAFRGEVPLLDGRLLPENNGQVSRNTFLRRGRLSAEKGLGQVSGLPPVSQPSTLYRYPNGNGGDGFWFVWGNGKDVDIERSPLADDSWNRVYWTGDGAPKMGGIDLVTSGQEPYPSTSYRMGVPAPTGTPIATPQSGRPSVGDYPATALETAYVVTLITNYGEESPPSPASNTELRWDQVDGAPTGGGIVLALPGLPSGAQNIVTKRIYRVESGGSFQFVDDVSASTSTYTDTIASDQLGLVIPSAEWDRPDDRMRGLTALPGGIFAGFFENTLCFSEAYLPHAWPVGYQLGLSSDIVALSSTAAGLVVGTNGKPILVTGSSPAAMAPMELDVDQPCLSKRSMVDMGDYAIYAGNDGLVAVGGSDARVITLDSMTRDQWRALGPETIHAYRYEERYVAFYDGGCFVFTPGQGFEFFDIEADAGYYDIAGDTLYVTQGNDVKAWGKGSPMTYTWRSRIHEVPPGDGSFSCAKVIAYDYPVALRLYADGELAADIQVDDANLFRLPPGYTLSRDWEVELEGSVDVASVQVATTPSEIV